MKTSLEDRVSAYARQLDEMPAHQHTPYALFQHAASNPTNPARRKVVFGGLASVLGLAIAVVATLFHPDRLHRVVVAQSTEAKVSSGLLSTRLTFPVVGPATYTDTLGAPRNGVDGTQVQEGIDLFAPGGAKVVALRAGRVARINRQSSGTSLVLTDADGNRYVYRRLENIPAAVIRGAVLSSGATLGAIRASTSPDQRTPPYLHLEIFDAAGATLNVYPLLRALGQKATPEPQIPVRTSASHPSIIMRSDVQPFLDAMFTDASKSGLRLGGSGFRSSATQIALRRQHCGVAPYEVFLKPPSSCSPPTARPGSNAHERGVAVDFVIGGRAVNAESSAYAWLAANASKYRFFQPRAKEPWHWEYRSPA